MRNFFFNPFWNPPEESAPAPANTVLPVISGTRLVGQTLSTTNGTWSGSPTGYTYQWKRDGVNIASATNNTYLLVSADSEKIITVVVTATNTIGSTSATSAAVIIYLNINSGFDVINLQSDSASRFTQVSNAISQWTDLSGNNNHAVQGTANARPLYNSGSPLWDGSNDTLSLTSEIGRTVYSLYIVFKKAAVNASSTMLFGAGNGAGAGANNFFRFDGNSSSVARQFTINHVDRPATANFTTVYRLGGEEQYGVLSIRRNGTTWTIKVNDRTLIRNSVSANPTWITYITNLGSGFATGFMNGNIRAFSMRTDVVSDAQDLAIRESLYYTYGILETSQQKIVCIGDSITQGGSVATSFPSYIDSLATQLGLPYVNLGIAGEKASDGLARYQAQLITRPYTDKVYIMFGANDISAAVSAASCANTLETIVNGLLTAGYAVRNICLSSPCYQRLGANAATLDAYASAISAKATSLGCRYANILTAMRNEAVPDNLMGDSLHPNSSGNAVIANTVYAAFQGA